MRIGIFSDTYLPDINGVVTSIETLRQGLIAEGHEVFVVANHSSLLSLKYENNILLLPGIELKFLFDYNMSGPINFAALDMVRSMNLDVIHVHTEFGVGIFARLAARTLEIPLVYTYHTTYEDYTHYVNFFNSKVVDKVAKKAVASLSKMLSNPASILITPSKKTKKMLQRYDINRPMYVIPTGIDLERFDDSKTLEHQRQVLRHNYHIPQDAKVFIFVGRIAEEKSIQLVIQAFETLVNLYPDVYLLVVGSGPDLEKLMQWVDDRGLQNHIIFTNRIENNQIPSFYHNADAFVSASTTETQGLTYIEAMACGLPIFASDMTVLEDLLFEGETGFYFEDEEGLIKKISHYLTLDKSELNKIKVNAKAKVKPYDSRIFVQSILKVYETAIDDFRNEFSVVSMTELVPGYFEVFLVSAGGHQRSVLIQESQLETYQIKEDRLLNQQQIQELAYDNKFTKKYNRVLDRLTYKDYSEAQVLNYLEAQFPEDSDNHVVVDVLRAKGLVNDKRLIEEVVARQRAKGYGYYRIEKTLSEYQFDDEILETALDDLLNQQYEDCELAIETHGNLVYHGSKQEGIQRLQNKLLRNGFESSLVQQLINSASFDFDDEVLARNCAKEYQRFYRRYSKSQDHKKAQQKTIQALLNKGFKYETIMQVVERNEVK